MRGHEGIPSSMKTPLSALFVEDDPDDARLVVDALDEAGFEVSFERVETEAGLRVALASGQWDVVLSDFALPEFDGGNATRIAVAVAPEVPVIVVTGMIGEERLADTMRLGARDFVLKEKLDRLGPAVRRELAAAQVRRDRRELEVQLRNEQERFRVLIEKSADAVTILARDGRALYGSPSTEQVLGYALEEFVGREIFEFIHPDDIAPAKLQLADVMTAPQRTVTGELRCRRKDGACRWVEYFGTNLLEDPNVGGIVVNYRDVTARKRAVEALQASERIYRAIGESIDYGVWICAPDGTNTYASESFLELVGMTQQQCANFGWGEALHPADAASTIAAWKQCVRTGGNWDIEHRFRGVDGKWHPVLARGVPVRDEHGKVTCWAGINLDIGGLRRVEEALRTSEARYRLLFEHAPDIIYTLAPTGAFTALNRAFETVTGWLRADWIGRPFSDLIHPDDQARVGERFQVVLRGEVPAPSMELRVRAAVGGYRDIEITGFSNQLGDGRIELQGIARDITDRKQADAVRQRRAEELERFNRLSVGRELQMIALKQQVNELSRQLGQSPPHALAFLDAKSASPATPP